VQGTAHRVTQVDNTFGAYHVVAQVTVDNHFSIAVMQGPNPIHELCYTTADRHIADLIHTAIKNGALAGHKYEDIAEAVHLELVFALQDALNDRRPAAGKRVEEINAVLERAETPDDKQRLAELRNHFNNLRGPSHVQAQMPPLKRIPKQPSDAIDRAVAYAAEHGMVMRGRGPGKASVSTILAGDRPERGWLTAVTNRVERGNRWHTVVIGAIATPAGKRRTTARQTGA